MARMSLWMVGLLASNLALGLRTEFLQSVPHGVPPSVPAGFNLAALPNPQSSYLMSPQEAPELGKTLTQEGAEIEVLLSGTPANIHTTSNDLVWTQYRAGEWHRAKVLYVVPSSRPQEDNAFCVMQPDKDLPECYKADQKVDIPYRYYVHGLSRTWKAAVQDPQSVIQTGWLTLFSQKKMVFYNVRFEDDRLLWFSNLEEEEGGSEKIKRLRTRLLDGASTVADEYQTERLQHTFYETKTVKKGDLVVRVFYNDDESSVEIIRPSQGVIRPRGGVEQGREELALDTESRQSQSPPLGTQLSRSEILDKKNRKAPQPFRSCNAKDDSLVLVKNSDFFHGRLPVAHFGKMRAPARVWASSKAPRKDQNTEAWVKASQYRDFGDVLDKKVELLAHLIQASKNTVVYSGAGISVASGIPQYAASKGQDVGNTGSDFHAALFKALPGKTHHILAHMMKMGKIQHWIQQNHDGLPQKAGVPEKQINEIHGSIYDPTNPVLAFDRDLREPEQEHLDDLVKNADLVISVGTALAGMQADDVVLMANKRPNSLGSVQINLQQTEYDGGMTLKINEYADIVLARVWEKLGYAEIESISGRAEDRFVPEENGYVFDNSKLRWTIRLGAFGEFEHVPSLAVAPPAERVIMVPYDQNGDPLEAGAPESEYLRWDLSDGALLKLHSLQHWKATNKKCTGDVYMRIMEARDDMVGFHVALSDTPHTGARTWFSYMGFWYLEQARRGELAYLPATNYVLA